LPTKSKKKQTQRRRTFWVFILLALAVLAGGWWLWRNEMTGSARFNAISIRVNDDSRKLLAGETLLLHPNDKVKIVSISTSIPLNLNVRLSAHGFDVNALQYETLPLADLLPQQNPFDRYRFVIHIKHYNQDLGKVIWIVQPYAEDWIDKADRIIDADRRIALLEQGQALLPENDQINRRLVDAYKDVKKWKKAAALLEKTAGTREDVETWTELLNVYQEMDDTEAEMEVLRKLIRLNPNDVAVRKVYAEKLEGSEDWSGAIREYEGLLSVLKEGERLESYKRLGYLYTKTNEHEKAIEAYLNAAKLDQKDANLHYNLSYLYEKIGQKEKADFYLDNAVTLKSGDLEGRLKLAHNLMDKDDFKKARKYLAEVLEQKPDDMKALGLMAQVLEREGDKNALKSIYQKILSINPREDIIAYNLGALEYEAGNLSAALPYFEDYATSHPEDANAHGVLFDIYRKQNDLSSALREAITMVKLRPGEADIYDFIVEYMGKQGDYKAMIPLLQKGVTANSDQISLKKYLVAAYLKTGEEDLAIRQMEEILREKPQDGGLLLLRDIFEHLRARKAYEKIVGIMKQAVEAYPKESAFRGYLIFAYLKTGKDDQAIGQMEAILNLRPDDLDLWLQLARLKEKTNDVAGASKAYQQVLEISPEHPEASEAYLRLRLKGVGQADEE
jgi:tetratricopeptide (TPR) repeat protein